MYSPNLQSTELMSTLCPPPGVCKKLVTHSIGSSYNHIQSVHLQVYMLCILYKTERLIGWEGQKKVWTAKNVTFQEKFLHDTLGVHAIGLPVPS
jgi:hypothetical protein